eukprot:4094016-Alexandrium_andersonii.AAC.1
MQTDRQSVGGWRVGGMGGRVWISVRGWKVLEKLRKVLLNFGTALEGLQRSTRGGLPPCPQAQAWNRRG